MFYKILILLFISSFLLIYCQDDEKSWQEQLESIKKQQNCTENPNKWCHFDNKTNSGCLEGYECHDIGVVDYKVGMCFRDTNTCKQQNSPCCDSTDCCRQVSQNNSAPLDCVQTYDNRLVCKVLIV